MKKLVIIFLLLAYNTHSQNDRVYIKDTLEKYEAYVDRLEERGDCSVRAIAEAFNLNYMEAHAILTKWGRPDRGGIYLREFMRGFRRDFRCAIVRQRTLLGPTTPQEFVQHVVEDGFVYIVMNKKHMFVIEQDRKDRWTIKGNYDDKKSMIEMYIKLNIEKWKK